MYLLTMGWFLAHTSLAMLPEHSATNHCSRRVLVSEICKSRALQEHVPLITQSSSVSGPTQTPVARQAQMAALLNRQLMRPHAKSQNPPQLCSAHGDYPIDWADLMCRTRKLAAIPAQLHRRARARSRVQGHSIKGCLLMHLKRQLQLIRLHLNRSTGHQRAGLAMLSKALEDPCSPAIAAPVMSYDITT